MGVRWRFQGDDINWSRWVGWERKVVIYITSSPLQLEVKIGKESDCAGMDKKGKWKDTKPEAKKKKVASRDGY